MASTDLPPDQAAHVIAAMRRLRETKYTTDAALARALGRSGASVGAMLAANPKHGPSMETARRVAGLLGVTVEELLRGIGPGPTADAYPERAHALARLRGLLPREVEERVLATVLDDTEPPLTEREWLELAMMRLRDHERDEKLRRRIAR